VRARVTQALTPFRQAPHVTGVGNPYATPGQLSADGHIADATIQFDVPGSSIPGREATGLIHDARAASGSGVTFSLGGDVVDLAETPYGGPSNGIGVAAAAIVLLIACAPRAGPCSPRVPPWSSACSGCSCCGSRY